MRKNGPPKHEKRARQCPYLSIWRTGTPQRHKKMTWHRPRHRQLQDACLTDRQRQKMYLRVIDPKKKSVWVPRTQNDCHGPCGRICLSINLDSTHLCGFCTEDMMIVRTNIRSWNQALENFKQNRQQQQVEEPKESILLSQRQREKQTMDMIKSTHKNLAAGIVRCKQKKRIPRSSFSHNRYYRIDDERPMEESDDNYESSNDNEDAVVEDTLFVSDSPVKYLHEELGSNTAIVNSEPHELFATPRSIFGSDDECVDTRLQSCSSLDDDEESEQEPIFMSRGTSKSSVVEVVRESLLSENRLHTPESEHIETVRDDRLDRGREARKLALPPPPVRRKAARLKQ